MQNFQYILDIIMGWQELKKERIDLYREVRAGTLFSYAYNVKTRIG